jgi:hypothetical protein
VCPNGCGSELKRCVQITLRAGHASHTRIFLRHQD